MAVPAPNPSSARAPQVMSALDEIDPDGVFRRSDSRLRRWIRAQGTSIQEANGGEVTTVEYPAEAGR